jgi:protein-tyrosine phosphatase
MSAASRIVDGLWVGGAPPPGDYSRDWDVIVFTAEEYQPEAKLFPKVRVLHYPYDDANPPSQRDMDTAWTAAEEVANQLRARRRVLVTCRMGRNRSALVAALALYIVSPASGTDVCALVREKRIDQTGTNALANRSFRELLRALP